MSKSRLEKFLYALYSLDHSDLPTPLSRIEELYKCWVTGEETPTFEPLSRVEKYLMAILGVYDVDSLLNPLSRVEVLLYKLATGDDNLDDVKSFLSEHEELLAEIIRNGGIGGNINIEYVLHTLSTEYNTLYNTAEKPVKSAILKGCTLVNIFDVALPTEIKNNHDITLSYQVNANETYTFIVEVESTSEQYQAGFITADGEANGWRGFINNGFSKFTVTTSEATNKVRFSAYGASNAVQIKKCMIIKGDYTNQDIPFFTGMQSVKMPVLKTVGKNLLEWQKLFTNELVDGYETNKGKFYVPVRIPVPNINEQYTLVFSGKIDDFGSDSDFMKAFAVTVYYTDGTTSQKYAINDNTTLTTIKGKIIDRIEISHPFALTKPDYTARIKDIALYQGSVAIPFEPYKSNILTTNEEVTLRGIGDVRDELDLLTGEVVNKFGEIVLNGDENWSLYGSQPNQVNTVAFKLSLTNHVSSWATGLGYCDKLSFTNGGVMYGQDLECVTTDANNLIVRVSLSKVSSVDKFKAWLSNNNIRVVYPFKKEVIKTVDLSTIDQDGNDTKLSTFNDLTHVTLSSEGLIPEAELEVATKNEEVINTVSLEMDDISATQTTLEETSNTQSENVDATMIATTEIYEGLL